MDVSNGSIREEGPVLRKARSADGPPIQKLLAHFAERGELLPRTLNEVYKNLRDFFVCEVHGEVIGVCALSLYWEDLAEVRSLAVDEAHGGRGLGKALVGACLDEAASLGVRRVFALTYRPGFFEQLGFRTLDKRDSPKRFGRTVSAAQSSPAVTRSRSSETPRPEGLPPFAHDG